MSLMTGMSAFLCFPGVPVEKLTHSRRYKRCGFDPGVVGRLPLRRA